MWMNQDLSENGVSKFTVSIVDNAFMVEMWGQCSPAECYWGRVNARVPRNTVKRLDVTWIATFANKFQTLSYLRDDHISLTQIEIYTDGSGRERQEFTGHFVRGKH